MRVLLQFQISYGAATKSKPGQPTSVAQTAPQSTPISLSSSASPADAVNSVLKRAQGLFNVFSCLTRNHLCVRACSHFAFAFGIAFADFCIDLAEEDQSSNKATENANSIGMSSSLLDHFR